jgi:hypothetical protein
MSLAVAGDAFHMRARRYPVSCAVVARGGAGPQTGRLSCLAREYLRLRETQMTRIGGLSSTYQAGLLGDRLTPPRFYTPACPVFSKVHVLPSTMAVIRPDGRDGIHRFLQKLRAAIACARSLVC